MDDAFAREVLFSLWSPIVAVTVRSGPRSNAFIASSVTCCSFGPPNPMRVTLQVLKLNYSYNLVQESQSFAINLISEDQIELVRRFGAMSGGQENKLAGVRCRIGANDIPLLNEAVAYLDCYVVNSMDAGDRTVFLADVVGGEFLREGKLLTYDYFMSNATQDLMDEYRANMAPLRPAIYELARTVARGS